jgi:transcriptional regulator with PAS, ATPase and Fis domain
MTQLNKVREQIEENRQVTEKFKDELTTLSMQELKEEGIVAVSEAMREALRVASRLARLEASNILILGESGSGKGLLAKFIHKHSRRGRMPFIQINCAALPETLLEAELFGYEKGAFTGAATQGKAGLIEIAQGGTLFLDEIGDLPLSLQAKLLKYLDDSEVLRLGSVKPRQIDCKIVAATNRDLEALMRAKKFRQDLFYRLNTFTLRIPPLRERPEDIFELVHFFLRKYNRSYRQKKRVSPETMDFLLSCPLPGNVRELKNILEQAVVMSEQETLDTLPVKRGGETLALRSVGTVRDPVSAKLNDHVVATEREVFRRTLLVCKSTREMAARLGVSQPTIVRKLKKLGLTFPVMQK